MVDLSLQTSSSCSPYHHHLHQACAYCVLSFLYHRFFKLLVLKILQLRFTVLTLTRDLCECWLYVLQCDCSVLLDSMLCVALSLSGMLLGS